MTDALPSSLAQRVTTRDWPALGQELDKHGCAILDKLLTADECRKLSASYPDDKQFRSRVIMGRHGFGRGCLLYTSPSPRD